MDPIMPWVVDAVGWVITKPRSMCYEREYQGEIAELGVPLAQRGDDARVRRVAEPAAREQRARRDDDAREQRGLGRRARPVIPTEGDELNQRRGKHRDRAAPPHLYISIR